MNIFRLTGLWNFDKNSSSLVSRKPRSKHILAPSMIVVPDQ